MRLLPQVKVSVLNFMPSAKLLPCPHNELSGKMCSPSAPEEVSHIQSRATFVEILGLSFTDDPVWQQVSLRIKLGSFGITELNQISCATFVSSWCHSLSEIPKHFPSQAHLFDYSTESDNPPSFYCRLCEGIVSLSPALASDGESVIPHTLFGVLTNHVKL